MVFKRSTEVSKNWYLVVPLIGFILYVLSIYFLTWYWCLLIFIPCFIVAYYGFRAYLRAKASILSIEFKEGKVNLALSNGKNETIENGKLKYAIMFKKRFQPVRAIAIYKKRKIGRGASFIGEMKLDDWEEIKELAIHLLKNKKFGRRKFESPLINESVTIFINYFLVYEINPKVRYGNIAGHIEEVQKAIDNERKEAANKFTRKNF